MLLLFGIFLTLVGVSSNATQPPHIVVTAQAARSISGHVTDDRHNPVADLQVELLNDAESVIQRTKTDGSGRFMFRRMTTGIFQVRVQTYGTSYIGQTKRVQLEATRAFEQVDFVLVASKTSTITIPGAVFVQEVPEPARKEFERAGALLQKTEQRNEGLAALKKAIEIFPLYYEALNLLGAEYVKQKEYEQAVLVLSKAIEVNSRAYHSLNSLSVAQYNLKQMPQAIESMRRAISLNNKSVNANLWLGMLLRQSGKLDEAEKYLREANELAAAKNADAHWELALLLNQLKKYKEAADELELFLKVQPEARDTELIKKLIKRLRQQAAKG